MSLSTNRIAEPTQKCAPGLGSDRCRYLVLRLRALQRRCRSVSRRLESEMPQIRRARLSRVVSRIVASTDLASQIEMPGGGVRARDILVVISNMW